MILVCIYAPICVCMCYNIGVTQTSTEARNDNQEQHGNQRTVRQVAS